MANIIQAIHASCPRINLKPFASSTLFLSLITKRSTLSSGLIKNVQDNEADTLIDLLLEGQPVHTGTATYTPSVDLNGKFNINVKVDARIVRALNAPGAFRGSIVHAERIGQSSSELVQQWNLNHPNDPVG